MKSPEEIAQALAAPGEKADFLGARSFGVVTIRPLNETAGTWLKATAPDDAQWIDDGLAVETRYIPEVVDAIIDAGFKFQPDR